MAKTKTDWKLTRERLHEVLDYNLATGVFIWKIQVGRKSPAGKIAGCKPKRGGYRHIQIDGEDIQMHRVAWFYVHGRWPEQYMDHIDRNRSNNAIANLREATPAQNRCNSVCQGRNKTGLKGISFSKTMGQWHAQIAFNRQRQELGYFNTPEEAHQAWRDAAEKLHGDFFRAE